MVKLRVIVTLVISNASLIRRCYLGVLEDLPEGVVVELGDPRAIARAALIAKRYEEARIRNPSCADKLLRLINRGACLPTAAQTAVCVSVGCVGTYGYRVFQAYGEGAGFQEALVTGGGGTTFGTINSPW